jgi:hypothetical protein
VQRGDVVGQRGQGRLRGQPGGGRRLRVEAIGGHAGVVDAGQRERRRVVAAHDALEAHAVLDEHPLVRRPEPVGRQPAEERHRLAQAADRA